ncbi:MAG: YegP family protein [Bryobacteraceae bacterium]|nr:YegP family protein [Bryobacteraceae bacterium]
MAAKFKVKKTAGGKFMFNLHAGNGEIILTSETYESKSGAENGVESVRANAPLDERYDRKESSNGQPYFTLKAANGQTIGKSEMYSSAAAMENGIASVKRNAPQAALVDEGAE